jgi:hypothetical protein
MRRIVRGFEWLIKGILLAIALAALAVWPWSNGDGGSIERSLFTLNPERVEEVSFTAGWGEGWIGIHSWRGAYWNQELREGRNEAAKQGAGWQTKRTSATPWFIDIKLDHSWGPLRWESHVWEVPGKSGATRHVSLQCWLLALLAGAWPLTSLTLHLRRRARTRRRARAGCCLHCGYDLRATPMPGKVADDLLSKCPECGTLARRAPTAPVINA